MRRLGYSTAMPEGGGGKPAIRTGPTTSGATVIGSSTQGIKTVLHSVSDLAPAKEVHRNG
jgi:hypothetical protein